MLSEALKARLSVLRQEQAQRSRASRARPPSLRFASSDLCACFPEGELTRRPQGELFACRLPLAQTHPEANRLEQAYLAAFTGEAGERAMEFQALAEAAPGVAALIDTETAGFYGRPLFLVGLVRWHENGLVLEQHFAPDYAQEPALLAHLADVLSEVKLLISFNGKAFDWPLVRDRMAYHRLPCRAEFAHFDLLHAARRRWRAELPNCRLQTLERFLCGRWRQGDLPSAEIPQRYHDYVREQDARLIAPVFRHNRMDLITMVELLAALLKTAR